MKALMSGLFLAMMALSVTATARFGEVYECGNLKNRTGVIDNAFTSYSIELRDDVVVLRTVHGDATKGLLSTTNAVMDRILHVGDAAQYRAQGITATVLTTVVGRAIYTSVSINDQHYNSAICHKS